MQKNRENARIAKAAGAVGLATLLSRIFGFLRDMVVAGFFGAGFATDAFFVAFRVPNLLRRLFAEGSLTISFVPVFTEYLEKKSKEDAISLADTVFTLLSIILVVVTLFGILISPLIVRIIAPGFTDLPDKYELTVFLTRLMFPYIFFISLVALCMGILNSLRHFAAPALAPVVLNIAIIFAAVFLRNFFDEPVIALAVGVLTGGVLQLVMQFPFLTKMGVKLKPDFNFRHPGLRKIITLMIPAVFGAAVYQINIFIGTLLASFLPEGSVSYLYYADRIVQLPLGVFAIAVGTTSLPSLSKQAVSGDFKEMKETISFSLRLIMLVAIPAMVALIALRVPIISVLFQRGSFDSQSAILTSDALLYYAVGLWAFSGVRVVVPAFYSLQDTKTPVKVAIIALIANIILSVILMFPLKHGGLALATSIASAVNLLILSLLLKRKIGRFLNRKFYSSIGKTTVSSLAMWGGIAGIDHIFPWNNDALFNSRAALLASEIVVGLVTFLIISRILKSSEMMTLFEIAKKKTRVCR